MYVSNETTIESKVKLTLHRNKTPKSFVFFARKVLDKKRQNVRCQVLSKTILCVNQSSLCGH